MATLAPTPNAARSGSFARRQEDQPGRRRRDPRRPAWQEEPSAASKATKALVLALIAALMIFPFVYVVAVSFSSYTDVLRGGLILFPRNPTLDAYREILDGGIVVRSLWVSAGITLIGTIANMVMTTALAYGLTRTGRGGVLGSRVVLVLVLFTLLFSPGLIPQYLLVKELGMIDTYQSLILPNLIYAFNLVLLRNFFMNLPQDLLDSAKVDGAGDLGTLWSIILPLSKPVLAVVALFYGVGHWNSFFNAVLYLNDSAKWPIQLVLRQYVLEGSSLAGTYVDSGQPPPPPQTIQMAVVVIATVPILLVYPFLQKYFTRGVLTGAIKG